jgi:membrane protease YdiL (CAAX protease family)
MDKAAQSLILAAGEGGYPMNMTRRVHILFGLVLSLGAAAVLTVYGPPPKAALGVRLQDEALWWAAAAALLAYVVLGEKLALSSAGLRRMGVRDWNIALGAGIGIAALSVLVYLTLFPVLLLSLSMSHVSNIVGLPWWYRALFVARVAFTQELMFRAYVIERLGRWIGAAVSLAVVIAATWSGRDPVESIAAAAGAIALTALYLWRRNAAVNMVAHAVAAGLGYLMH